MFVVGFLSPALIPLVLASALPAAAKTALSAGLAFGIPELTTLVAIAILGQEGFQDLKRINQIFPRETGPYRERRGL